MENEAFVPGTVLKQYSRTCEDKPTHRVWRVAYRTNLFGEQVLDAWAQDGRGRPPGRIWLWEYKKRERWLLRATAAVEMA